MKLLKVCLALLLAFVFISPALATDWRGNVGGIDANNAPYWGVDSNGTLIPSTLASYKTIYETATTSDTLTATESGKTIFVNISSGDAVFTLPTAAAGLTYTFTAINGNGTDGQGEFILNPQSTDTFYGCVSSSAASTFSAGDDLDSPHQTGDSVTITSPAALKWVCTNRVGTFVDGN